MKRIIKISGTVVGLLIGLFLITIFGAMIFLDPNDYKTQISEAASKKLGHKVSLQGPLEANYFPWLGITAKDVIIEAQNKVSDETLAQIGELSFKVKTIPFLRKDIQIDTIIVKGIRAHLERDKAGKANWEPKFAQTESQVPPEEIEKTEDTSMSEASDSEAKSSEPVKYEISGIEIIDAQIIYHDLKSKQQFELKDFQLSTDTIKKGTAIPVKGHFSLHMADKDDQLDNTTDFSGIISYSLTGFALKEVNLSTELIGEKLPRSPLNAALQGEIISDLFNAEINFNDIILDVDESHASGSALFSWTDGPHLDFNLDIDKVDAGRYMAQNESKTSHASIQQDVIGDFSSQIEYVSLEPKKTLSYKGDINLGQLKAQGLTFTQVKVRAQNHKQGLLLKPMSTNFYDGHFNG
jgi:AsmA protein